MPRLIFVFVLKLALMCGLSAHAQDAAPTAPDRSATGRGADAGGHHGPPAWRAD